jgi:hypothetical protein
MKSKLLPFLATFLICQLCYAQQTKVPKNLNQALSILRADCSDSLKNLIKTTNDDKLLELSYPWGGQYKTIDNWLSGNNKEVKISKYLANNGITYIPHQETIILIAFKNELLNNPINERTLFKPYQNLELKWSKEDAIRFTTDSLRGVYIPKDPDDCFKQIDKFWNDSTKRQVKLWTESEFTAKAHLGFGMWMRNNWQLWGGSRLSKYFNGLGISNPEDMSGIILASYHRYLLSKPIKLDEQLSYYKDYWKKAKLEDSLNKLNEFKEYKVGDTVIYKYRFDYVSKKQEDDFYNDICKSTGIIMAKNDTTLQLQVKIIEICDTKGIIIYDSKDSYVYYKHLKQWLKPKKRQIIRAHANEIKWFNYDSWEIKD